MTGTLPRQNTRTQGLAEKSPGYKQLDDRVVAAKGETWKAWGLYDIIMLSIIEICHDFNVVFPLMGFLSTSLNAFVFLWGMLTPTLLDVAGILGLPIGGKVVHVDPNFPTDGFVYDHNTAFQNLLNWKTKKSGDVIDAKHQSFLMYFFNKFFYGSVSVGVV